eukprot:TRINITY_DN10114_c0_g1_i1.p1 TRINITY_DN10114_c0_g1~~TRINITY_DN10114_c0_g1_i1.p1  ORF type:complete len:216 (-),score=24.01 TRINITY_DN10114_c0_g1_i1:117-764(-)
MDTINILSIEKRFQLTKKLIFECESQLNSLIQGDQNITKSLNSNMNLVNSHITELQRTNFSNVKNRIESEQLFLKYQEIRSSLNEYYQQKKLEEKKNQLLFSRFNTDTNDISNLSYQDDTEIIIETEKKVGKSLNNSMRMAEDWISTGEAVIEDLQYQKGILLGTKRKINNVSGVIEVSTNILHAIQRRIKQDTWIIYGGMIFIILMIILLMYYF